MRLALYISGCIGVPARPVTTDAACLGRAGRWAQPATKSVPDTSLLSLSVASRLWQSLAVEPGLYLASYRRYDRTQRRQRAPPAIRAVSRSGRLARWLMTCSGSPGSITVTKQSARPSAQDRPLASGLGPLAHRAAQPGNAVRQAEHAVRAVPACSVPVDSSRHKGCRNSAAILPSGAWLALQAASCKLQAACCVWEQRKNLPK